MKLRDYQQEAVDLTISELGKVKSTLIVQPTGTGKTVVFSSIIKQYPKPGRWMVLAHREELIRQAADKIAKIVGEQPDIEMANERADLHMFSRTKVVVATVQTLTRGRMNRFNWKDFAGIITDEAHHATAQSYQKVYAHARKENPDIRHVGVTATPDRTDETALGKIFDSVAYEYSLIDAINDGYLVDVHAHSVEVKGLDFAKIRTTAGDLNGAELAQLMEYEDNLHRIAQPTMQLAKWRKVLVFAASLAHAERLSEIFNRYRPGSSRWFSGETPKDERRLILSDFSKPIGSEGSFQFLVNVGVLTEGYDEPTIDMVVMGRPTKSRSLYSQMVGRGTRPLPGIIDGVNDADGRKLAIARSAKPNVVVLDFVGNSGHHKLVTTADILGGNYDDEVVEKAKKEVEKDTKEGKAANVQDSLRKAERDIHADRERERVRRQAVVAQKAEYSVSKINPFDIFGIEPARKHTFDHSHPMTDNQRKLLTTAGIATDGLNRADAGKLSQEVIARRASGKCTFNQAKLLRKYGYDTNMNFDEASRTIDAIKQNGWKRPGETKDSEWETTGWGRSRR